PGDVQRPYARADGRPEAVGPGPPLSTNRFSTRSIVVIPSLPTLGTTRGECITGRGEMYRPGECQSRANPRTLLGDAIRRLWTREEPWQGAGWAQWTTGRASTSRRATVP